ncbi:AraC family transcriptional regulator [uncultured Cohaesibacter sp.]|uniref:helix-turn-helix domain-containing protein n=1 Tax=uncultured Cohaesibacter sp. TaxID=1002546 RepID=UPI002AAAAB16|nr:AraC family transcriptional regulator [uncultured Cohaesibacter sp.]
MPAIPVPFLATALLLALLIVLFRRQTSSQGFLIFLAAAAFQTAIVGLRWSWESDWLRTLQPISASLVPIFAYFAIADLDNRPVVWWKHAVGPVAVILAVVLLPFAIDPLLSLIFLVYAWLVFASQPQSGISPNARFGSEVTILRMRKGLAFVLAMSAVSDLIVSALLSSGYTVFAAPVVAVTVSVVLLVIMVALLGRTGMEMPPDPDPITAEDAPVAEVASHNEQDDVQVVETLAIVEALFNEGLYKDYDLTLARLARRAHVPARTISRAVNDIYGVTITDLVNRYRVEEAMRLLRETDMPVTEIMLEAGFQTKSNFNRVFKALAGQTPSAYRTSER